MRVAFWWKVNWSWFCVIKVSLDGAMKSISEEKIEAFPDDEGFRTTEIMEVDTLKKEDAGSPTPRSSDQDTISEPMEDVVASQSAPIDVPEHLRKYWDMSKRLGTKPRWPTHLGEDEWITIGDVLVELGNELVKYGLLDMELGLWENEIMHRMLL
jgi:hypothetical protein